MLGDQNNIQQVKEICRNYREAKRLLSLSIKSESGLQQKLGDAQEEYEKRLFTLAIEQRENEIDEAKEIAKKYERCWLGLPEEEKTVIDQLYRKGCKWTEVRNENGNLYSEREVVAIWKRAIRRMGRALNNMNSEDGSKRK